MSHPAEVKNGGFRFAGTVVMNESVLPIVDALTNGGPLNRLAAATRSLHRQCGEEGDQPPIYDTSLTTDPSRRDAMIRVALYELALELLAAPKVTN